MKLARLLCAWVASLMTVMPSQAVSLRPEKATDGSVCDLGPNTNAVLGRRTLVPGDAAVKDQAEAYFRLAAKFVLASCAPGQMLVVHGESTDPVDAASLPQLANSACVVAEVKRAEVPFTYSGRTRAGFELRCHLLKLDELAKRLMEAETSDPTASLYSRMAGTATPANASNQ